MILSRVDLKKYIVVSIWWGCNNNCNICMLSGLKRKLPAIGFDTFKNLVIDTVNAGEYENLILTGAEVTTFEHLERYAQFAASLGWFKKIQIQTNARNLRDKDYLKKLVNSGINEFFVSIHGHEKTHEATTRITGSFKETMDGIRNLESFNVNIISNTVLTKLNLIDMVPLMATLFESKVSEHHMWNYFPMEKEDRKDLIANMDDFAHLLPELLSIGKKWGKALIFKSFPECLSAGPPGFFDNWFPVTVLPDTFWKKFSESGFGICVHRDSCRAKECWGLSKPYVQKYGYEKSLLSPIN